PEMVFPPGAWDRSLNHCTQPSRKAQGWDCTLYKRLLVHMEDSSRYSARKGRARPLPSRSPGMHPRHPRTPSRPSSPMGLHSVSYGKAIARRGNRPDQLQEVLPSDTSQGGPALSSTSSSGTSWEAAVTRVRLRCGDLGMSSKQT